MNVLRFVFVLYLDVGELVGTSYRRADPGPLPWHNCLGSLSGLTANRFLPLATGTQTHSPLKQLGTNPLSSRRNI